MRQQRLFCGLWLGCVALSLLYWLLTPALYESAARVAALAAPAAPLSIVPREGYPMANQLSAPLLQETLAGVFRSDHLAWRVIAALKLAQEPAFAGSFAARHPDFDAARPSAEGQAWLLERFARRLRVRSLPHTLLIEVAFRSRDPQLSARVVEALLQGYAEQESETRRSAVSLNSLRLQKQLSDLKTELEQGQERLARFQQEHGVLSAPEIAANGRVAESERSPSLLAVEELGRRLAEVSAERMEREAEYQAARHGDPEFVLSLNARLRPDGADPIAAQLREIHSRRGALEQELAQLRAEHGPNYPRVVEIDSQLRDLERQRQDASARLVDRFQLAWRTAAERESKMRSALEAQTAEGMRTNKAAAQYIAMRAEAESSRELYLRVRDKVQEAALTVNVYQPDIAVVDPPRAPVKAVSPNLLIDLCVAVFVGFWLALVSAIVADSIQTGRWRAGAMALLVGLLACTAQAQAPTPSTSGLPTGVARIPLTQETRVLPNAMEAPAVWGAGANAGVSPRLAAHESPLAAPLSAGDLLEISEFRTPEFHTQAHLSQAGSAALPMIGEIHLAGLDEQGAARAIERALVDKGILLHPHVTVLVSSYAGQDVSVLGEVSHPGVYPYTAHHRLLDLISAASGLSASAGRTVNITHRGEPGRSIPVLLDPSAADPNGEHNPELDPGDTVQVGRAGLVYVVGSVIRPGGFTIDPSQKLSVVQALTLAWGATQNASVGKALLIRDQKGGRTITTLNLKRMLRGEDPDLPVLDRDVLYVPASMAKNLWNRTLESTLQSLAGVSIYSGLVYSQRY